MLKKRRDLTLKTNMEEKQKKNVSTSNWAKSFDKSKDDQQF